MSALVLRLRETEEVEADAAFLHMSKLRDLLVRRNAKTDEVDTAIEALTKACRS